MTWQWVEYMIPLIIGAAFSIMFALYILWRRHEIIGAGTGALILLAAAEWVVAYVLELGSTSLPTKIFWGKFQYVGIVIVPLGWLIYVLKYTGRERWLTPRNQALLSIVPFVTLILVLTNETHHLIWSRFDLVAIDSFLMLSHPLGAGFWVYIVYSYMLLLFATFMLIQVLIRSRHFYRWQVRALLLTALLPWMASALQFSNLSPFWPFEVIPLAFALSGPIWLWGLTRLELGEIVSISRDVVIENVNDGVMVLDEQNDILDLNPIIQNMIGCTASEAIGQSVEQVWQDWPVLARRPRDRDQASYEVVLGKGDDLRNYDVSVSSLTDWRSKLVCRVFILRDISERKQVEETLRTSEGRYRLLAENARDVIWTMDLNLRFTYMSPSVEGYRGYTAEEVMDQTLDEVLTPPSLEIARRVFDEEMALEGTEGLDLDRSRVLELEHTCKDGSTVWAEIKVSALRDDDGKMVGILGVSRDITERKLAEEVVREAERRYKAIFDSQLQMVYIHNEQGIMLDANDYALERLGYTRDDLGKVSMQDILHQEDIPKIFEGMADIWAKGFMEHPIEISLVTKSGEIIWVETFGISLERSVDHYIGLGMARDITERKRAEDEIKTSLREKEILLKEIHHRVKNNLQIVSSLLNLQSETIEDPRILSGLKDNQNRVKSMALIHEKLYGSKDVSVIDLKDYIHSLIMDLAQSCNVDSDRITIRENIENLEIGIDKAIPCGLIINELVSNSMKYAFPDTRAGEIQVSLKPLKNKNVELMVSDNGVGLPKDLDIRKTDSLGLHLVTILVEDQLDGSYQINNKMGTKFTITFSIT